MTDKVSTQFIRESLATWGNPGYDTETEALMVDRERYVALLKEALERREIQERILRLTRFAIVRDENKDYRILADSYGNWIDRCQVMAVFVGGSEEEVDDASGNQVHDSEPGGRC